MDAVGSNIRVDSAADGSACGSMPRLNEDVNEEWLRQGALSPATGCAASAWTGPMCAAKDGRLQGRRAGAGGVRGNRRKGWRLKGQAPATAIAAIAGDLMRCRVDVGAQGPDARISVRPISTAGRTAPIVGDRPAPAISSIRPIAGIEEAANAVLADDRQQYRVGKRRWSMPGSASAWLQTGNMQVGPDWRGDVDLTYPADQYLGARARQTLK